MSEAKHMSEPTHKCQSQNTNVRSKTLMSETKNKCHSQHTNVRGKRQMSEATQASNLSDVKVEYLAKTIIESFC